MSRDSREHWGSKIGFLMATAGSAIGLGSLWRFPYMTAVNGGGLFVLSYIFFTFLVSLPIFIAELIIGRHAQRGPVDALSSISHSSGGGWRNVGWICTFSNFIILSFYCVVSGWSLHYIVLSLQDFTAGKGPDEIAGMFDRLYTSADLNTFWLIIFMSLTVGVVLGGIKKGIEMWSRLLTPTLFILMATFVVYCSQLSGFGEALSYIFTPDWSNFSSKGILEALGMAFFTLSVGLGILITYGSYLLPSQTIPSTALSVAILNVVVSLMAALIIFPLIFTFDFAPDQGPGLVFKILPVLFEQLPGTKLLSTLFFLVLLLTAVTSSISILEVLTTTGMESFGWSRRKSTLIWIAGTFVLALPSAWSGAGWLLPSWTEIYGQDFLGHINILPDWLLTFCALAFAILTGWKLNKNMVKDEFCAAAGPVAIKIFPIWYFSLKYVAPLAITAIFLHKLGIFSLLGM